ncbi:ATP-binding protein [Roseibium porphyridii]|uniref:ATP-binding protein n=1 Tax=Roseibium porphyridii TaxID=2866279 RepID=A0ABY8F4U8_9HYPH|nr:MULTISPECIES: ATP-binding protein [Stappiaceae]QFT29800.1 Divergent AAA domain protein [Labrenzia sp. THAF82]WFE90523.1 ATP-binding protein [Roseibium sp. KMA01]
MSFSPFRLSFIANYVILGAFVGVLIIHPLNLIVVWWELSRFSDTAPNLMEFLSARLWLVLLPRHLDVAVAYTLVGAIVGLAFGIFSRNYMQTSEAYKSLREEQTTLIPDLMKRGETSRVEFKSSLRWDMQENHINRGLEKVIAKTLAGFYNAEGGHLLIGVNDAGEPLGLDKDLATLKSPDLDAFERTVNDIVSKNLGGDLCPYIHTVFASVGGRDVAMIIVRPAPRAVYMEENKASVFYLRSGNSTRKLDVREAVNYANTRWS